MVAKAAYGWDSESCVWELKQLMSGVQGQNVQGVAYMEDMPNAMLVRICQTEDLKCRNAPHLNTVRGLTFSYQMKQMYNL